MRIDYKTLQHSDDIDELKEAVRILNSKLYHCQEELYRVWAYSCGTVIKPKQGWPVGEMAGAYDLIADEALRNFEGWT